MFDSREQVHRRSVDEDETEREDEDEGEDDGVSESTARGKHWHSSWTCFSGRRNGSSCSSSWSDRRRRGEVPHCHLHRILQSIQLLSVLRSLSVRLSTRSSRCHTMQREDRSFRQQGVYSLCQFLDDDPGSGSSGSSEGNHECCRCSTATAAPVLVHDQHVFLSEGE